MTKVMDKADQVLSTEGMVKHVRDSKKNEFVIATETGVIHKMEKENPGKKFYPAVQQAVCGYMKLNTLEKIVRTLEKLQYEVKVPEDIARRARIPIERMLQIVP